MDGWESIVKWVNSPFTMLLATLLLAACVILQIGTLRAIRRLSFSALKELRALREFVDRGPPPNSWQAVPDQLVNGSALQRGWNKPPFSSSPAEKDLYSAPAEQKAAS